MVTKPTGNKTSMNADAGHQEVKSDPQNVVEGTISATEEIERIIVGLGSKFVSDLIFTLMS